MANKTKRSSIAQSRRKGRIGWLLLPAVVVAVGVLVWTQWRPQGEASDPNVSDPNVVVNLTTMVGKQAPDFTLTNSDGLAYSIVPGDGRKVLLIFHMGSI